MKRIISLALVCIMLLGCVFALASCGKSYKNPEEAVEILEEEGYIVYLNEFKNYIYAYYNNVHEKAFEEIEIFYYSDEDAAEKAWETLEAQLKAKADAKDENYQYSYGIDGSLIYYGTKAAIKAAK